MTISTCFLHSGCKNADSKKGEGDWRGNQQKAVEEARQEMEEEHCGQAASISEEEAGGRES